MKRLLVSKCAVFLAKSSHFRQAVFLLPELKLTAHPDADANRKDKSMKNMICDEVTTMLACCQTTLCHNT